MRGTLRIGRLFGIEIAVDWSWLLVFLLMSWNLTVLFRDWHPTWMLPACFLLAVTAALLFFASVLAHELAHSVVAKSYGLVVREIRLFLFGGVSNIEKEPPSAKAELWIAIVGPLTSVAIGMFFIAVSALAAPRHLDPARPLDSLAGLGPLMTLFFWLGPVNIAVGIFNMIPGFPLDGGRVLRAILWKVTGDLHRATLNAARVGRVIGGLFIVAGVAMAFGAKIPFFGQGAGSGIWLAFIGWFLSSAAERSFSSLLVHEVLDGVHVSDLMRYPVHGIPSDAKVDELVNDWFARSREQAFAVTEYGSLLGVVSVADTHKVTPSFWDTTLVTSIMTPREKLLPLSPQEDAESALRRLSENNVEQLPVLDANGSLVGMLSHSDITRWLELHIGGGPGMGGGGGGGRNHSRPSPVRQNGLAPV